jgi:hypothetical protein
MLSSLHPWAIALKATTFKYERPLGINFFKCKAEKVFKFK